ncbi:WD repeat domain-containing protein [Annulohypoxylon maeteangense]|uniref:WD repeat domain-containing protein n=1 Tax=Annulohypoxylon maeteangense TaxID=1927788 RepID=UPI002007CE72|nr:WD repeat domain-containing protein [Annulohypoxylon maeteangense]KAI0881972.1 WD repeat domain-containing protein [Annulohypoxylon maeteangense]
MPPYGRARKISLSSPNTGSLDKDVTLPGDAEDTISSISWSHASNHLAAASWDGKVRVYNVSSTGVARGVTLLNAEGPVLDCDWAKDGSMVVAGGADKKLHLLDISTSSQASLGAHDAPIRNVRFIEVPGFGAPVIVSGSWDKTVKFWDLRQQGPLATVACKERVYSMDSKADLMVVATAECHIHLFDLKNPTTISETVESPLKYQTKVVAAFPDGKGWATASIEGRCGMRAVEEKDKDKVNFTFKCHREKEAAATTKVFTVNDLSFHPVKHNVFSTAGSEGTYQFWDRIERTRLKAYQKTSGSITSAAYNRDGTFFAYAVGYDWSRGHAANTQKTETKLMLHPVSEEDIKKK